jgi:hypothetical protein
MNEKVEIKINAKRLPDYDIVVCGGGFAGACAAISAGRQGFSVLLVESGGCLGGAMTQGLVPQILDPAGKGGLFTEINEYLIKNEETSARVGSRYDNNGRKIPGTVVNVEIIKYLLDKLCREANVDVLYHTIVSHVETDNDRITGLLLASETGNYFVRAMLYIDATGNGTVAVSAGCSYEFGHPQTGNPQPCTMITFISGIDVGLYNLERSEARTIVSEVAGKLRETGANVPNGISLIPLTPENLWLYTANYQYNVRPDDPYILSRAITDARIQQTETFQTLRSIKGFEKAEMITSASHIGIREGWHIQGKYRITVEDIVSGARFDDGICLVRFGVDVHPISKDDKEIHSSGRKVKPYHIPYRALVANDISNLLLSGRCISGDFYAHSSYRVIGNMIAIGEACGYAAAECIKQKIMPAEYDGKRVAAFMAQRGYEL